MLLFRKSHFVSECGFFFPPTHRMEDFQLCNEITRLKRELQELVSVPGTFKQQPTHDYVQSNLVTRYLEGHMLER